MTFAYKEKGCDTSHYKKIEGPFEIPESWEWCRVADIANSILYGVSESAKPKGRYKLLRITDIQGNKVDWNSVPFTNYDEEDAQKYLLNNGDILFARTGATVGKSYLVADITHDSIYASYLIRIQTSKNVSPEYVKRFFESGYYWEQISSSSVGVGQPNVNGTSLANLLIPIPPFDEQKRIVLETEKWFSLIESIDKESDCLSLNIGRAKSLLLILAISGKLVPQDSSDEPAIELLRRINPDFKPCDNSHYPFDIPDSWSLSTFGQLNNHQSKTINPLSEPEKTFELYSVPIFETGKPEILKGIEIGSTKQLVHKGEVLVCKINPHLNRVWVVEHYNTQMNCIASSEWIVFQHPALLPRYALLYFQSPYFRERLLSNVSGVGGSLMRARPSAVDGYFVPIPPINEQRRIVQVVDKLLDNLSSIGSFL